MKVTQIYDLMNTVTNELLGKSDVVAEDLSNIVDVGTELFDNTSVENYTKTLVDHIGRMVFVNRPYVGRVPSVLMDSWEFGAVLEKVTMDIPDAAVNETWDLTDKQVYEQDTFYKPSVSAKFFSKRVTFEIPISITDVQVKSAFSSASELNSFISMIYNAIDKSMRIKTDALIMRTINNFIGETIHDDYAETALTDKSGVKAVNLLKRYNDEFSPATPLTAEKAINDPEFLRYASLTMSKYIDRLSSLSSLYNIGGKDRQTPRELLHVVMLSDFIRATDVYLQSSTFHDEYTALPNHETVPCWQGTGQDASFAHNSYIHITTASGATIEVGGVLGVMFDRDALGVSCLNRRTTTHYNARAEFTNNFNKMDAGYFNDGNENFVVFFIE